MDELNWNKNFTPPIGGWSRLERKLAEERERERQELQLWKIAAPVLLVSFGVLANQSLRTPAIFDQIARPPTTGELLLENGEASPIPGTEKGVHLYWMMQNN